MSAAEGRRWAARLAWLAAGIGLAFLLFVDPLDLHPVDEWLRPAAPPPAAGRVAGGGEREVLFYRNPMDPTITSPVPAKDEMGMDYLPVYADEAAQGTGGDGGVTLRIDPTITQNMNVQSVVVERRDLSQKVRTVGYLEYDQERMVTVTTKYDGWVEKVYVNYIGEPVRRGQPLFEIYSPDLVQTAQELLSARRYASSLEAAAGEAQGRAEALVEAARTRLTHWDVSPEQIAELERTGEIFRTLKVVSPASGLIMKRLPGLEGMAVRPGLEIFHIANLSTLWLSVELFEEQVARIREGTPAEVVFGYFPGETFRGTVRFVEPAFSEKTRTLSVKIAIPNRDRRLRAGMFATVVFRPTAAPGAVAVPSLAVLRTGERNVVVVELDEGVFTPREVVLGREGEGMVEVLSGVEAGERVVTSAQFLLDSEASLQEAVQKMVAQRRAASSGHSHPPMDHAVDHATGGAMEHAMEHATDGAMDHPMTPPADGKAAPPASPPAENHHLHGGDG